MQTYLCRSCGQTRRADEFHADKSSRTGRSATCRHCRAAWRAENRARIRARDKEYRANNKEKIKAANAKWGAENPIPVLLKRELHRAKSVGAAVIGFGKTEWAAKLTYWDGRCWVCGETATQIDHVKPIAAGGSHVLANLRPVCAPCNSHKATTWLGSRRIGELATEISRRRHSAAA